MADQMNLTSDVHQLLLIGQLGPAKLLDIVGTVAIP